MVLKKAPKSKPKSQAHSKPKDGKEFNAQLGALGLRIVHITADGNCLFRAVADQLEGNEEEHLKYRTMVVDYIQAHREEYEPFLEDDVPFDDYCKSMRETSTWAGNMELQVISLVTHTNICIHRVGGFVLYFRLQILQTQLEDLKFTSKQLFYSYYGQLLSPRWHIQNFQSTEAQCIHLSYHNGEHYNSIRRKDDNRGGPAKCILLKTPALEEKNSKDTVARQRHSSKNMAQKKVQLLCAEEESFEETGGDLIGDDAEKNLESEWSKNGEVEEKQSGDLVQELEEGHEEAPLMQMASSKNGGDAASNRSSLQVQKVARNKTCPCGSRRKYKACCGTVKPHNRPQDVACATEGLSNKARKQKVRNSKGTAKAEPETTINKEPLDMGFLCI